MLLGGVISYVTMSCMQQQQQRPFNSPLFRIIRVCWYQKGKTSLGFIEARDSEWQWHHLHLAPDRQPCQQPTTQKQK